MKKGTDEITLVTAKTKLWETIALFCWPIFFLAFTVFIYAPFEIYLNNVNEFAFGLGAFWWMPLGVGILVLGLLIGFGLLINLVFKRTGSILYGGFVFAIALACYLQGNFLRLKVGVMTGVPVEWTDYMEHIFINIFIWACAILFIFTIVYFLKRRTVKIFKIASFIAIAMQAVALTISLVTTDYSIPSAKMGLSTASLFELSAEHNVIIFTLDKFDDEYFERLLESDPSYKEKFDGFTRFTNSVGSASTTQYSVSAILTGHYPLNEGTTLAETFDIAYGKTDFYEVLSENNFRYDIYAKVDVLPNKITDKAGNYVELGPSAISNYTLLLIRLYKLVLCKYAPDMLKAYIWLKRIRI